MTDQEKLDMLNELTRRGIQLTGEERKLYDQLKYPIVKTMPDGSNRVTSTVQDGPPSAEQEALTEGDVWSTVKPGVAPTVGQMLGSVGRYAVKANPWLGALMEGGGAALGEIGNQLMGVTPESAANVGLTAAVPGVAKGGVYGVKQLPRLIPGAKSALHEEGLGTMRQMPNILTPKSPSGDLYDAVDKAGNPFIPTGKISAAVKDLRAELDKITVPSFRARYAQLEKHLQGIEDMVNQNPMGAVPYQELRANQKTLNAIVDEASPIPGATHGDLEYGKLAKLKRSFADAMDEGAKTSKVPEMLKYANQAYRKELAQDELTKTIERVGYTPIEGASTVQVNPQAIAKWIKDPKQKDWRASIEPEQLKQITNWLDELGKLPKVRGPLGAPVGTMERATLVGVGGVAGHMIAPGAMGATLGALALNQAGSMVAEAMMTPTGRRMMMNMFRASRGTFGEQEAMALATFLNATSGTTRALTGADDTTPPMMGPYQQ